MNTHEKKYKEEVVRATQLWECGDITRENLEYIFPELAESEDEKIRKWIIDDIRYNMNNEPLNNSEYKKEAENAIAWLEKQGDKPQGKTAIEAIHEEKVDNANKVEPKFKVKYAGSEYNVLEVKDIAGVIFYGIEDEPNHIDYVKPENCEIISGYAIKENGSPYPTKPAVFSEQKPTDNTEPKFHEGDWIAHNTANFIFKIINVGSKGYEVVNRENYKRTISFNNEDKYHLWTIEDAKSGDVLIDVYGNIGIYEECDDFDWMSYCSLGHNGGFQHFKVEHENEKTHPATKEQRDLLFQKMKEAGWKWDKEKKGLKKIEQKPAEWSEDDEIRLDRICKTLWKNRKGDTDEIFQQEQDVDWLKSLKDRVQPQSQPAWSEEDECYMGECISAISTKDGWSFEEKRKTKHWLEQIKQRIGE
jgi:hypothetical protein